MRIPREARGAAIHDPPGTPKTKGKPGRPPHGRPGLGHTGTHHGGAVMNVQGHIIAEDCSFVRGSAYQGGALYTYERLRCARRHARCVPRIKPCARPYA